ncbi:hypothetical protein RRG08_000242 [Elysia crispata]|uniref:Uncharacterized protein n=1 Tax=Elysia crispata TaxID=231223 RepID=A0AAE1AWN8_9GAST|nr:hypothetical protein RRG08_000242 [Elysia crispata]
MVAPLACQRIGLKVAPEGVPRLMGCFLARSCEAPPVGETTIAKLRPPPACVGEIDPRSAGGSNLPDAKRGPSKKAPTPPFFGGEAPLEDLILVLVKDGLLEALNQSKSPSPFGGRIPPKVEDAKGKAVAPVTALLDRGLTPSETTPRPGREPLDWTLRATSQI